MEYLKSAQLFLEDLNDILSKPTIEQLFCDLTKEQRESIDNGWKRLREKEINRNKIDEKTKLLDIYMHSSAYTVLINDMVLPLMLQKREMKCSNEYYRIDVIGYRDEPKEDLKAEGDELKLTPYCWGFEYAAEHENDIGKWIDEAIKLSYINCHYKIIIGYNRPIDEKKGEKSSLDLNKKCFRYLLKCFARSHVPQKDNKLIILFGIRNEKGTWDKIEYEGYAVDYCERKVYELTNLQEIVLH